MASPRVRSFELGFAALLFACSSPPCEETLTCPRPPGAGNAGSSNAGSGSSTGGGTAGKEDGQEASRGGQGTVGQGGTGQGGSSGLTTAIAGESSSGGVHDTGSSDVGGKGGGVDESGDSGAGGEAGEKIAALCGNGITDEGEECDLGKGNRADAYGDGSCTSSCKRGGYCGDGRLADQEVCDDGDSASRALGACNPECTGYYEKKRILPTTNSYKTNLGGPPGADDICRSELDGDWKALIVGGTRRATVTALAADGQLDWVIKPYTHYYNGYNQLIWRTDEVPLLGVRDGMRLEIYAPAFDRPYQYPWSGYDDDWTTFPDDGVETQGTCAGWTTNADVAMASFASDSLRSLASEPCGSSTFLLCVEQ